MKYLVWDLDLQALLLLQNSFDSFKQVLLFDWLLEWVHHHAPKYTPRSIVFKIGREFLDYEKSHSILIQAVTATTVPKSVR